MTWWQRHRRLALVAFAAIATCGACRNQEHPARSNPEAEWIQLQPEETAKGIVNKPLTYRFDLNPEQPFVLSLQKQATGVSLSVLAPDGHSIRSTSCLHDGTLTITEVASVSGRYAAKLDSCEKDSGTAYQLTLSLPNPGDLNKARVQAERLSAEAEQLVEEYTAPSRRAGIAKSREAQSLWKTVGDPVAESRMLTLAARVYRDFGESVPALSAAQQALALAKQAHDAVSEAEALVTLASVQFLDKASNSKALGSGKKGLEVARSVSNTKAEAAALYELGLIPYDKSEYESATAALEEAKKISLARHDTLGAARATLYLAAVDFDTQHFDTARDKGRETLAVFNAFADKQGQATALTFLGHFESALGRNQEALSLYEEARRINADSGDYFVETILINGIGKVHFDLGNIETSLEFLNLALKKNRATADPIGVAYGLRAIGDCYFAADDLKNALDSYKESLRIFRDPIKNARMAAYVNQDIGVVLESMGKIPEAMETLNESLRIGESLSDRRLQAWALTGIGHVYETSGKNDKALQSYEQALLKYDASGDRLGKLTALYYVARVMRNSGRLREALDHSEKALDEIEKFRASVANSSLRTSYFASMRQQYDLYVDVLMRLKGPGDSNPFAVRAFEASERSRARTLLESIRETRLSISQGGDPKLMEREAIVGSLLDSKVDRYTELVGTGANQKDIAELSAEIRRLTAEHDELRAELRAQNPRHASLVQPVTLTLAEIQKALLDNESLLLEYALGDDRSYLWAVTRDGFTPYVLPKRSEIEANVRLVRESMTPRTVKEGEKTADALKRFEREEAQSVRAVAELSRMLLGPVADQLRTRRLVIVAEGALNYLPFAALPIPSTIDSASPTPLITRHEIVNLPSATTLAVIRKEASLRGNPDRTLAIFADPVFQIADKRVTVSSKKIDPPTATRGNDAFVGALPRLLATEQEARAISDMVPAKERFLALGFDATKMAAIDGDLSRYRIVHFATHTSLNENHPDLSSLVLSLVDRDGNPINGYLRLRDIYNMKLSAELVVLSACETAIGKEVKGEGLMSMVRGFMYSGTPRVLASLWKVDDESTAELMKEFYKELLQNKRTPAAALRQAQITQMQKKSRRSPYYWAGFQLQGEWKP